MKITAIAKDETGTTVYIKARQSVRIHIETNGSIEFCSPDYMTAKEESELIAFAIAATK